ncbi:MAG TPA: helix-turn-helix transcriptional regulator [Gemmataceae bacterium]|nr:helix-turn-helix transcriptional regulator [Gemmataceae bacterium]
MAGSKTSRHLTSEIRQAILAWEAAGRKRSELARLCGVQQSQISRFLRGGDLRGETLAALCRGLGLELRKRSP